MTVGVRNNRNAKSPFLFNSFTANKDISGSNFNFNAIFSNPAVKRTADYLNKYSKENSQFMRVLIGKLVWKIKYKDLQKRYSGQDLKIKIVERRENHIKKWGPLAGYQKKIYKNF